MTSTRGRGPLDAGPGHTRPKLNLPLLSSHGARPWFGQAGAPPAIDGDPDPSGPGSPYGLDGGEDLQGVAVQVVDLSGDESFGGPLDSGGAADGGEVVGVSVGGG